MTRKDYIALAKVISDTRYNTTNLNYYQALNDLTLNLAVVLKAENPRFDVSKFFQACEYGKLPRVSEVA